MGQRSYTAQYRADAVKLAYEIGSSAAARELKMPADTLYTWVSRAKMGKLPKQTTPIEPQNALSMAERIKQLEAENKALKSELIQKKKEMEILEGAAVFSQVARRNRKAFEVRVHKKPCSKWRNSTILPGFGRYPTGL